MQYIRQDEMETPREARLRRAANKCLVNAQFSALIPEPQPEHEYERLSMRRVHVRLKDEGRGFARHGDSMLKAVRLHCQRNGQIAKYTLAAYREAYPLFVAANLMGAMPLGDIIRHRASLAWNVSKFGVFLALDTALVPGARSIAAEAVSEMMQLMYAPRVVPIRP